MIADDTLMLYIWWLPFTPRWSIERQRHLLAIASGYLKCPYALPRDFPRLSQPPLERPSRRPSGNTGWSNLSFHIHYVFVLLISFSNASSSVLSFQ